jgi:hypothetical protein
VRARDLHRLQPTAARLPMDAGAHWTAAPAPVGPFSGPARLAARAPSPWAPQRPSSATCSRSSAPTNSATKAARARPGRPAPPRKRATPCAGQASDSCELGSRGDFRRADGPPGVEGEALWTWRPRTAVQLHSLQRRPRRRHFPPPVRERAQSDDPIG